jgi:hypothetical protein
MPELLRVMHASMQFSDTVAQHQRDADRVFRYAKANGIVFLTGTEGGGTSLSKALAASAKLNGFRLNLHRSGEWVAVNGELATVIEQGHEGPFIPGTKGLKASQGGHAPRGITWTTAQVPKIGKVTTGSVHYLTRRSMDAGDKTNDPLARGIASWGRDKGKGRALVLVNGDMNMDDARTDTFLGGPFTSVWDELKKWPGTLGTKARGRTIDVSASYDHDRRVSARSAKVLDDRELQLGTDHFPLVAVYAVEEVAK